MIPGTNISKDFYIDRGADFEKIVEISVNFSDYDFVGYIKKNLTSSTAIPFEFHAVDNEPKKMRLFIAASFTTLLVGPRNAYDIFATDPNTELSHKELAGTVYVSDVISIQPNPAITPKYLELFLDRGADFDKIIGLSVNFDEYTFNGYIKKSESDIDAVILTIEAVIDEPKQAKISVSAGNSLFLIGPRNFFEIFATHKITTDIHKELGGPVFVQDSISFGTYPQPEPGERFRIEFDDVNGLGTAAAEDVEYFATAAQGLLADTAVQPEDLPTFGDIVTHDISEFASSTQGALADTAVQPEDLPLFGDIVTHNISEFATAAQGLLADSAIQSEDLGSAAFLNVGIGSDEVAAGNHNHDLDYSSIDHNHAGVYQPVGSYSLTNHDHDLDYAPLVHNHDLDYSAIDHNHAGVYQPVGDYALDTHNHDLDYAPLVHNHDLDYSAIDHNHAGVYQPVGDYATVTYADSLVIGLVDDRGSYDASITNQFPISGGSGEDGAILKGDLWTLSGVAVSGDLFGYPIGCLIRALEDAPGQTLSNWSIVEVGFGYVPENAANKVTTGSSFISNITSTTKYPSNNALDEYLGTAATHDTSTGGNAGETDTGKVLEFGAAGSITANKSNVDAVQFDVAATPLTNAEGLLQWNSTDGTLDLGMSGGTITMQIGQEMFQKVRNVSGAAILNGSAVYTFGRTGNRPNIYLAKGDAESTSEIIGVTTQDISDNADGFVTTIGYVRGIKTNYSGTGDWGTTWVTGDRLYVSKDVAGKLTNVEPSAPHHSDVVGTVEIVHNNLGSILIRIDRHKTLSELSDVNGAPLITTGQIPVYHDGVNGYFDFDYNINDYLPLSGGDITGSLTIDGDPVATVVDPVRTTLTGNGVLSSFAIGGADNLINPSALIVAIDGAMQEPVVDYIVASGIITFTSPLASGAKAVVISPTNVLQMAQMVPADGSVTSAKLDTNLSIAGSLSVIGNAAFTSTTRPISNATGTPASNSLITKDDFWFESALYSKDMLRNPWRSYSASGAGTLGNYTTYGEVLYASTTAGAGAITASARGNSTGVETSIGYTESTTAYGSIDFTKEMIISFEVASGGGGTQMPIATAQWALFIGYSDTTITSDIATLTPTNTQTFRGYVTLKSSGGNVFIVTQSGNAAVSTSATLDTHLDAFARFYTLRIIGGVVYLYRGRTLLGSVSGAPTGLLAGGGGGDGLLVNASNSVAATVNQSRLYIRSLKISSII